mmetsp:Transcript_124631/g.363955  ORF Transcript_124631/g.363955 Transcript_124631/m.363955 type:complete len:337 (-) Transcript_124631:337-1347(-)
MVRALDTRWPSSTRPRIRLRNSTFTRMVLAMSCSLSRSFLASRTSVSQATLSFFRLLEISSMSCRSSRCSASILLASFCISSPVSWQNCCVRSRNSVISLWICFTILISSTYSQRMSFIMEAWWATSLFASCWKVPLKAPSVFRTSAENVLKSSFCWLAHSRVSAEITSRSACLVCRFSTFNRTSGRGATKTVRSRMSCAIWVRPFSSPKSCSSSSSRCRWTSFRDSTISSLTFSSFLAFWKMPSPTLRMPSSCCCCSREISSQTRWMFRPCFRTSPCSSSSLWFSSTAPRRSCEMFSEAWRSKVRCCASRELSWSDRSLLNSACWTTSMRSFSAM